MSDGLNPPQCVQFLFRALQRAGLATTDVGMDDLDGLTQSPRRLRFPHLAIAAATQLFKQAVARQNFGIGFDEERHTWLPESCAAQTGRHALGLEESITVHPKLS